MDARKLNRGDAVVVYFEDGRVGQAATVLAATFDGVLCQPTCGSDAFRVAWDSPFAWVCDPATDAAFEWTTDDDPLPVSIPERE